MKRARPVGWLIAATLLSLAAFVILAHRPAARRTPALQSSSPALNTVRFEENCGQADPATRFIARGGGAPMLLSATSLTTGSAAPDGRVVKVEMRLVGANPLAEGTGLERLQTKTSYYIGSDSTKWRTGIPSFKKVRFDDVYSGIDLLYYGASQPGAKLEYDFVIEPGADPDQIELQLDGYEEISLDADGGLRLRSAAGELRQLPPLIYQPSQEGRQEIDGRFVLADAGRVRFELDPYDSTRTLLIDPGFEYSTFFGGENNDQVFGVAVDSQGNAYITGFTESAMLPATGGSHQTSLRGPRDAFVASINPGGSALGWSTYFGGRGRDQAWDITVDRDGNAYITGSTDSPDFATTDGSGPAGDLDSFAAVFGSSGSLRFSTRQGGSRDDEGLSIDVNVRDEGVFLSTAGRTASLNFPVTPDAFQAEYGGGTSDGFINLFQLDLDNLTIEGLNRSTSFDGGSGSEIIDTIKFGTLSVSAGLRGEDILWISSSTSSDDRFVSRLAPQPTRAGGTDGHVAAMRLDPTFGDTFGGGGEFGTYVGGSKDESESELDVRTIGEIFEIVVSQVTKSDTDYPVTDGAAMTTYPGGVQSMGLSLMTIDPAQEDWDVTRRKTTYFGGNGWDQGPGLAFDPNGGVAIGGFTFSGNLPTTANAIQRQRPGGRFGAYIAWFGAELDRQSSFFTTYLGGPNSNLTDIAIDPLGQLYAAGINPNGWPTTSGSFQPEFPGAPFSGTLAKVTVVFPLQRGLVNAASFRQPNGGGYSFQEILTDFGGNIGPTEPALLELDEEGKVKRELGRTTVSFNDDIVAMIFASINQTSMVAPGPTPTVGSLGPSQEERLARVQFSVDGDLSPVLLVPMVESNSGIFSVDSSGQGQGAILNHSDSSLNDPDNPAPSDGFITVYGTGGGVVDPSCPDGGFGPVVEPLPRLTLPQRALIGGVEAEVHYAGSAPTLICGVNQWNLRPTNNPVGDAVTVQVCSGDNCSQEGITAAFE